MKNLIDQLALGKIEYHMPDMEFSVSQIQLSLQNGEDYEGFFQITTQATTGIKGLVYSDRPDIKIVENAFQGKTVNIYYQIHASISRHKKNADRKETWRGAFSIVSNAGEAVIPYEIQIENTSLQSSIGEIRDLFHFANLVQMNNEEAMSLFYHKDFVNIFLKGHLQEQAIYESVRKNVNKDLALEEFLLAVHKKKRVQLEISDVVKEYTYLTESYGDCVVLTKSCWGYIEIDIEVEGNFLVVGKHKLTSEDFAGSNYEFHYLIDYEKCADGMNYGAVYFRMMDSTLVLHVIVDNGKPRDEDAIRAKKDVAKLMDMYLQFRLRQYPVDRWMKDSMKIIEHIRGTVDDNNWIKIVQAQIMLTQGNDEDARFILDSVENRQKQELEQNKNLYGYYLYVRTLEKQEQEFTKQTVAEVKKLYENGYASWQLLWVLSYLDDSLEYNKSLKLLRIKEEFNRGCSSPLMYYEALDILNSQPELLRMLNDFEIQVLYFGHKRKAISERLAKQIVELSLYEKRFRPLLYKILCGTYEEFENIDILSAICGLLIRGNIHRYEDFKWFELGVQRGLKIAGLYESYMYAINTDNMLSLPKVILMYFSYNSSLLGDKMAYLYANILANKNRRREDYEKYLPSIEQFAMEQIMAGNINKFLVSIYQEVLTEKMITSMIARRLPDILKTCYLECSNPNIRFIHVAHKELTEEQSYALTEGRAYFPIYTEDAVITLEDRKGNRILKGVSYHIKPLFRFDSYLKKCYEVCPDENPYLLMYFVEKHLKYHNNVLGGTDIFEKMLALPQMKESYRLSIIEDVIDYYVDQGKENSLDTYLAELDLSKVEKRLRVKIVELMIARGLYRQVYDCLKRFGLEGESPGRILKFCSRYISIYGKQEDEFLTQLCMYAFRKGKYDENMLSYLGEFYYGNTKDMVELWKACDDFGCESPQLEERIIVQLIFTRGYSASMQTIFASYYDKRMGHKLVCAYLTWKSFEYFVKEAVIDKGVFIILEKELFQEDKLADICKLAYLKYMSAQEKPGEEKCRKIEEMLQYLCKKDYLFSFYKSFIDWCKVPYHVIDQTVLEYRCVPGSRVLIHYRLDDGNSQDLSYTVEEMRSTYTGVYTKAFTLFYGENIDYYITEESSHADVITQSDNLNINFREKYENDSRFGLLNDMMVCQEMMEEVTLRELMSTYMEQNALTEKFFQIR